MGSRAYFLGFKVLGLGFKVWGWGLGLRVLKVPENLFHCTMPHRTSLAFSEEFVLSCRDIAVAPFLLVPASDKSQHVGCVTTILATVVPGRSI